MKIFLSWSGDLSHRVACTLRDWLPSVIQSLHPYVSSEDIDKGARWSTDIAQELAEASYGIICITNENINAPWINFEAGALSKSLEKSNVSPFLFQIKRSDVQGPLLQFQSTIYDQDDVKKLIHGINRRLKEEDRLTELQIDKAFTVWWPQLRRELDSVAAAIPIHASVNSGEPNKTADILEEVLELARNQQRIINNPESLIPPAYLRAVLRDTIERIASSGRNEEYAQVHSEVIRLEEMIHRYAAEDPLLRELATEVDLLHKRLHSTTELDNGSSQRRRRLRAEIERETKAQSAADIRGSGERL
jgi:hypothetical protein